MAEITGRFPTRDEMVELLTEEILKTVDLDCSTREARGEAKRLAHAMMWTCLERFGNRPEQWPPRGTIGREEIRRPQPLWRD